MAQPFTIKSGDERNDVAPIAPRSFSKFNLSHRFLQTMRFGEISPSESWETMKGAKDSFRLQSDTSSLSLKAPLKTDMFQKHSNFFVPLQAILKNNWELFITQPNSGDDVPDDVDGVVSANIVNNLFVSIVTNLGDTSEANFSVRELTFLIRRFLIAEMFFSQGSLCRNLYLNFTSLLKFKNRYTERYESFDQVFEYAFSRIAPADETSDQRFYYFRVQFIDEDNSVETYLVVPESELSSVSANELTDRNISFRHFLDLARQNLNFVITSAPHNMEDDFPLSYFFDPYIDDETNRLSSKLDDVVHDINFDKLSAYQLVCAHFFSLDHVDYIYSAELYRQLIMSYLTSILSKQETSLDSVFTFNYNSLILYYDALSGHAFQIAFERLADYLDSLSVDFEPSLNFMTALFSFRHSLRYLDYFTGGRTRPLSVGTAVTGDPANPTVPVVNNQVNSVEVIIAQNAARYLNFAQRVGRKVSQWLDKLFPGGQPRPDMHDPQWLSTTGDALNPEQTQNTGEAQATDANSITARFKNDSNRYMFTLQPDRPGYVICVTYYDIPRSYAFATARENFHKDRYDRFNPFFQYNGSQEVYRQEIGLPGDQPFSYQGRYEEYKQNYDVAAGGFVEFLPGFAFVADVQSGLPMQPNLNPTYVRSWNCELDPFYLSLTGYGLAAYFHFIVKNVNLLDCVRPAEYAPQLM